MRGPSFLLTAKHVHPGVNTAVDYAAKQAEYLGKHAQMYPNMPYRAPWVFGETCAAVTCRGAVRDGACVRCGMTPGPLPEVFISGGVWLVECACGNCPVVEPEWEGGIARCYEVGCGAVYRGLQLPIARAAIEAELLLRPRMNERYWTPDTSILEVIDFNRARGYQPAPAESEA